MKKRCTPQLINEIYQKNDSWRKAANELNALFEVDLSQSTWHDFATGRRDIANRETRAALGLAPRLCPKCGKEAGEQITQLLKRLTAQDLQHWNELHEAEKHKEANLFLEEVTCRQA